MSNDTDSRDTDLPNRDPLDIGRRLTEGSQKLEQVLADLNRNVDEVEERRQIVMSHLKTGAVATVTITGLTLAAVFAFCGAVWANPSTPMLRACADSLLWFGIAFLGGLLGYTTERMVDFISQPFRKWPFPERVESTLLFATIIIVMITIGGYTVAGVKTLQNIVTAFRNEATLFNNEGTVKSEGPKSDPGEFKPLGEFRTPSWFTPAKPPD